MAIAIRPITAADTDVCGRILYAAFKDIADRHNFPPDFASSEHAVQIASYLIGRAYGVVAEQDGRVVGSNFLAEHDAIRFVGPISVDPTAQAAGAGRALMRAVLDRARGAVGVRLVQDAFNTVSMPLYASLGFEAVEPLVLIAGQPRSGPVPGVTVRPMTAGDVEACAALCRRVHGISRANELLALLDVFTPAVVERDGRITAYASSVAMWQVAHGVAETEDDLHALLLGAANGQPVSFLLPIRQASLFRWCLQEGLRVVKPMTLMTMGYYQEPRGSYFPSVGY